MIYDTINEVMIFQAQVDRCGDAEFETRRSV